MSILLSGLASNRTMMRAAASSAIVRHGEANRAIELLLSLQVELRALARVTEQGGSLAEIHEPGGIRAAYGTGTGRDRGIKDVVAKTRRDKSVCECVRSGAKYALE